MDENNIENHPLLGRLFREDKDWDWAVVLVPGANFNLAPNTKVRKIDGVDAMAIINDQTADPFYDPRRDGQQPRICNMEIILYFHQIVGVNYVSYPRIVGISPVLPMKAVTD